MQAGGSLFIITAYHFSNIKASNTDQVLDI